MTRQFKDTIFYHITPKIKPLEIKITPSRTTCIALQSDPDSSSGSPWHMDLRSVLSSTWRKFVSQIETTEDFSTYRYRCHSIYLGKLQADTMTAI